MIVVLLLLLIRRPCRTRFASGSCLPKLCCFWGAVGTPRITRITMAVNVSTDEFVDLSSCCGPRAVIGEPPCNCTGWEVSANESEIVWISVMLVGAVLSVILHSAQSKSESRNVDETLAEFAAIRAFREMELKTREEQRRNAPQSRAMDSLGNVFSAVSPQRLPGEDRAPFGLDMFEDADSTPTDRDGDEEEYPTSPSKRSPDRMKTTMATLSNLQTASRTATTMRLAEALPGSRNLRQHVARMSPRQDSVPPLSARVARSSGGSTGSLLSAASSPPGGGIRRNRSASYTKTNNNSTNNRDTHGPALTPVHCCAFWD